MKNKKTKSTADNVMVYPVAYSDLTQHIEALIPNYLKAGEYLNVSKDAVIMVPGGFFLVNQDCCYQPSITELSPGTHDTDPEVTERFNLSVWVNRVAIGQKETHNIRQFSYNIDCRVLLRDFCGDSAKTLREFMGSRYGYNPRVNKNLAEMLEDIDAQIEASPVD